MWGLYLTRLNSRRQSSCCGQCAVTPDFIPPWPRTHQTNPVQPVDYIVWSIMQEKVCQTHRANVDELKHWLVAVWAKLDLSQQLSDSVLCRLNACDTCVNAQGDILDNICVELIAHTAHWFICWIVGLYNDSHRTLLPPNFVCFMCMSMTADFVHFVYDAVSIRPATI